MADRRTTVTARLRRQPPLRPAILTAHELRTSPAPRSVQSLVAPDPTPATMRVLFLTPQLPYPPRQGATLRNFHLILELAREHHIDLLTFLAPGESLDADNRLYEMCDRVHAIPQPTRTLPLRARLTLTSPLPDMAHRLDSAAMHNTLAAWIQDGAYDVIQFEGIEMAPYLATARRTIAHSPSRPALLFDNHNCEYLLQKRNAINDLRVPRRWLGGIYSAIQWWKLRRYERWACSVADCTVAVSHPDADALARLTGHTVPIHVIPNGIALETESEPASVAFPPDLLSVPDPDPNADQTVRLVFTGKMDYRPNVDAVLWFGETVLPLIVKEWPSVLFQIVGMNPHPRILPLAESRHVEITGAVDDVRPYIQGATAFVIPLRVGGGTRFKVLEAMSAGKAIVSTSLGVEGIPVVDGQHLILADTPADFAQAVNRLIQDRIHDGATVAAHLGAHAQEFVAERYAWDTIVPALTRIYQTLTTPETLSHNREVTE